MGNLSPLNLNPRIFFSQLSEAKKLASTNKSFVKRIICKRIYRLALRGETHCKLCAFAVFALKGYSAALWI
jgi:hypothetical protein